MARASQYEAKKHEVLGALNEAAKRHSKPPTVRDLADWMGVGVATTHSYLRKLAEEGLVEWKPGRHRTLSCTEQGLLELSSRDAQSA